MGVGEVVLTDTEAVLPLLQRNIDRNASCLEATRVPTALPLDWESGPQLRQVVARGPFDVVVATDVVFA
eukprot:5335870-Pyramimonas_sp.AAC.1